MFVCPKHLATMIYLLELSFFFFPLYGKWLTFLPKSTNDNHRVNKTLSVEDRINKRFFIKQPLTLIFPFLQTLQHKGRVMSVGKVKKKGEENQEGIKGWKSIYYYWQWEKKSKSVDVERRKSGEGRE